MQKKIWMFWLQGWDNATELSKICLKSWKDLNPGWMVIPLSQANISDFLDLDEITDDFYSKKPISCTVDLINLNLLKKYGGVWVDSTVLCLKPLDSWLQDCMKSDIFTYKFNPLPPMDEGTNKTRLLSTWFIAANKSNHIIDTWCDAYNRYWLGRFEPDHYFDFHHLFYDLYHKDETFKKSFDDIPEKNSWHMQYLNQFVGEPVTADITNRFLNGVFEMTKYQNIYKNNSYEDEEIVKKLISSKHNNHLQQSGDIQGLKELYAMAIKYYL